jgi:hypothetical protein
MDMGLNLNRVSTGWPDGTNSGKPSSRRKNWAEGTSWSALNGSNGVGGLRTKDRMASGGSGNRICAGDT